MLSHETDPAVFQLKISLKGSKPPIWRRILIESACTLEDLHFAIQSAMGWSNSHLHAFEIVGREYGPIYEDDQDLDFEDEADYALWQVIRKERQKFLYRYDFGDDWEHEIVLEKKLPADPDLEYPRCIAGELACPPEDSGGLYGYYNKLAVLGDPDSKYYKEIAEWMGADWDASRFDLDEANANLQDQFRGSEVDVFEELIQDGYLDPEDSDNPKAALDALFEAYPCLMEMIQRIVSKLVLTMDFKDETEAVAYLAGLSERQTIELGEELCANDPVEKAQQLALRALQDHDPDEARSLAEEALQHDPLNTDAQLVLARFQVGDQAEYLRRMREIFDSASARLGSAFIEEHRGRLADCIEGRPYLRARLCLANALVCERYYAEAITHMQDLLSLDAEDTMRIRHLLLGSLLAVQDHDGAAELFRRFPKDKSDTFLWGRVLERFLRGNLGGATKALAEARSAEPRIEAYFAGEKVEDGLKEGVLEEAVRIWYELGHAWQACPEAMAWLASQAPDR